MKLYLTAKSERGKEVTKSGNDEIIITLTEERRQKFDITFDGSSLRVMSYANGVTKTINYIEE